MKKGIFKKILPLIIMGIILSLSPLFLKASATVYKSDTYVRVYTDNDSTMILFQLPYIGSDSDFNFLYNEDGDVLLYLDYVYSLDFNGQLSRHFYANGDTSKPMTTNQLYLLRFDNGINRYVFYSVDLIYSADNIFTGDRIILTELFTISDTTRTVEFFDIIASGYIMRYDYYSNYTTEQYKNTFLVIYFNSNPILLDSLSRYSSGYSSGYNTGYNTGYNDGQAGDNAISPFLNIMSGIWGGVDSILQIEIVPHIKLWYFVAIPLFFIVIWGILKIWRHN